MQPISTFQSKGSKSTFNLKIENSYKSKTYIYPQKKWYE
jgi:hypothetical protein